MYQLESIKWFQFDFTVGKTVSGVYRPLVMVVVSVQAERLEHGFFLTASRGSTIVCHQLILSEWPSACCCPGTASCLDDVLARWHCLTWTCGAGVRELRVNQFQSSLSQCDVKALTWAKGENKLRRCQSCSCRSCKEGGGSHRSERKASCSSPPARRLCSVAGPQRQDTRSLGPQPGTEGARGFREGLRMPLLNINCLPIMHCCPSLPLLAPGTGEVAWKELEPFYLQVPVHCAWSVRVAFGFCRRAPVLDVFPLCCVHWHSVG